MDPQTPQPSQVPSEPAAPATDVVGQVVGAIQNGKNILVTVEASPTVDELASALGLTFLLGKLNKHATAVFSGKVPPAMEFLDPEKTFESTVDSLRDFIIALDKEKADKLRYKVEDDVVKVFITPYKTVISEKDLQFSQGDFNVDVVVALGVTKREALDKAITSHGRILHDASVITVNAGGKTSNLGSVDWNDSTASSTAEMMVALSEALGGNLLDNQISTAFLTGIVAETNRFSNEKTTPKVMSLSAQLMAAGANQQLIATNLRQEGMISEPVRKKSTDQPHDDDGEMVLDHKEEKVDSTAAGEQQEPEPKKTSAKPVRTKKVADASEPTEDPISEEKTSATKLEETLAKASEVSENSDTASDDQSSDNVASDDAPDDTSDDDSSTPPTDSVEPPKDSSEQVTQTDRPKVIEPLPAAQNEEQSEPLPAITPVPTHTLPDKPTFGGTLNATTAEAEEDRDEQQAREAEVNNVALSHDESEDEAAAVEAARQAVEDANTDQPFNPANQPLAAINSQPLPGVDPTQAPDTNVSAMQSSAVPATTAEPEPNPVDAFMQPHSDDTSPATSLNALTPSTPVLPPSPGALPASDTGLPPLPALPGTPAADSNGLPPLPPLPGQSAQGTSTDPAAQMQPQINPAFMQDMPQSQNPWSQAADDMSNDQAARDAARQEKMDQMTSQYDTAVDRNREIQGLPPLNNPNGSGLPPLPPLNP